jgi:hypothetical protein
MPMVLLEKPGAFTFRQYSPGMGWPSPDLVFNHRIWRASPAGGSGPGGVGGVGASGKMKIYQRDTEEISEDFKGGWLPEDALDSRFLQYTDRSSSVHARQRQDSKGNVPASSERTSKFRKVE